MYGILLILSCLLLSAVPSYAARGFGATDGTTTTDKIVTGATTMDALTSWSQWIWLTGAGGANLGRIWDKDGTTTGKRVLLYRDTDGLITFNVAWDSDILWTIAALSTGAWHHLVVTYNGSATANNPIIYVDGSSVAVTGPSPAVVGTLQTNTGAYLLGNRSDNLRHLNGRLAEVAIWNGTILSAGDVTWLYNGGLGRRADSLPSAPTNYWKLCAQASPEPNDIAGGSTGTVTGALTQTHPFANCQTKKSGMHR